jgi:hypothetical protein
MQFNLKIREQNSPKAILPFQALAQKEIFHFSPQTADI